VVHGRVARAPVAVQGEEVVSERVVGEPPSTPEGWAALGALPAERKAALGLRRFGREEGPDGEELPDGRMLWVFPGEWYDRIPDGLEVVDIFFRREAFRRGVSDDDRRFGCLAYGVLEEAPCPSS
jgi:hypothetical protein